MVTWGQQFGESTRGRIVALLRRGPLSIEELAAELGVTDNAVRAHIASLERDEIVAVASVRRAGGVGKPATLYRIAPGAEPIFSSAYAPALAALVAELGERMTPAALAAILRAAGRRIAPPPARSGALGERARAGLAMLSELGGDAELERADGGYRICAFGCPLSVAVVSRPETCRLVEQLLAEVTGARVRERCDRSGPPRCRFQIDEPTAHGGKR